MGNSGARKAEAASAARQAEAKAKAAVAQAQADARKAEQARLQAQYEADARQRAQQLRNAHEKQQAELKAQQAREQQQHAAKLKEMERASMERIQSKKIAQKNAALNEFKNLIKECESKISESNENKNNIKSEYDEYKNKIETLDEEIKNFNNKKCEILEMFSRNNELPKYQKQFERINNEINAVIDLASVHSDNVGKFLSLTQELLNATLCNQEQANKLSAEISTFGDLIGRASQSKLSVEHYFLSESMQKFTPILAKEDLTNMKDLICEGDDKEDDYDEIMELINDGLKKEHEQWEKEKKEFENKNKDNNETFDKDEPKTKLSLKQKKFFKKVCLKPETWQNEQNEKIEVTKESLNEISPLMAKFFNNIHITMKQAQLLLTYNNSNNLSDEQKNAIAMASKLKQLPQPQPQIQQMNNNNNSNNDDNDNEDEKNDTTVTTGSDDTSNNNNQSNKSTSDMPSGPQPPPPIVTDMEVVSSVNDESNQLELMNSFDNIGKEMLKSNMLLNKAAIHSINVVASMSDEFDGSGTKLRALGLAQGIEGACMEIVRATCQIRQSLILGHAILRLKPAKFNNDQSKELWNSVDSGIVQIFNNALKMSQVSAKYFSFFLKFKQSFAYYLSCGNDRSLLISTEHLTRDVNEFKQFSNEYNEQVKQLSNSAMKCIENCVRNTAGADNFAKNQATREEAFEKYLSIKKQYDLKSMELDAQYGDLLEKRAGYRAKADSLDFVIKSLEEQIEHDRELKKQAEQTMAQIEKQII